MYRCLLTALFSCAAFGQVKLDFVTQLKGSDADVVRSVAVDRDGNIIVAGTTRSPDLATPGVVQPARASSNLFRLNGQGKLVFAPGQPAVFYAGAGKRVYRSTNGGQTFIPISAELVPNDNYYGGSEIATDPFSPSTLFVFAIRKSFRTDDGGNTWQELPIPVHNLEFDQLRHGTIYGIYVNQLLVSNDGGATWKGLSTSGGEPRVI